MPDAGASCGDDIVMPNLLVGQPTLGATVGVSRSARVELDKDYCAAVDIALTSSNPSVATVPAMVTIAELRTRTQFSITPVATGRTTISARWTRGSVTREVSFDFVVVEDSIAPCTGNGSGMVVPGTALAVSSGSLTGAKIFTVAGAANAGPFQVPSFAGTIGCAPDQLPEGYKALGPAITFGPAHQRFARDIALTLPMSLALLPARAHRGHVELAYTGPGVTSPRIVPIASPTFEGDAGATMLSIHVPRLGTYQAVTRAVGPEERMRTFKWRGITGVSMGGGGSGLIGMNNPERFDFVAPLGGPTDWIYLLHYVRTYHLGGFCTAAQRESDPTGCATGSTVDRTPATSELFEHAQDFEHWWYEDEYSGQGGTFDRREYTQIFRDLSMMYGNPNTDRTSNPTEPTITPPGTPDSERMKSDAMRCANPIVIPPFDGTAGKGYFDDEYNPDGMLPAISFCEGAEVLQPGGRRRDIGVWDPAGDNNYPFDVAYAIDVNANGRRDPGEPVVRAGNEPFDDFGLDNVASADEAGYDAVTNPDPAGDDYDYQYNPNGTERNRVRDGDPMTAGAPGVAEAFRDLGLDGVMGTAQTDAGGFDTGEGNGRFDMARGLARMFERNPRSLARSKPIEQLRDVDVFADGGIRDLFNFAVVTNQMMGSFGARGLPLRLYDSHAALHFNGEIDDERFVFTRIAWDEVGKYIMVRYGDPDASEGLLTRGDGGHVGTGEQAVNRILSAFAWMSARWPDGDRVRLNDQLCPESRPGCEGRAHSAIINFTSPTTGRTGPASIVLPPGYFFPENAGKRYPVIYFGHGYGMDPTDFVDIGIIFWNFMVSPQIPEAQRLQKMIFVFPDGFCREGECIRGTFFTNAPASTPMGAQMETWMLELMDYVDANYRTRRPEAFPVID